jgi:hypothetical protein
MGCAGASQGLSCDPIERAEKVLKESGAMIENARHDGAYNDLGRDLIVLHRSASLVTQQGRSTGG